MILQITNPAIATGGGERLFMSLSYLSPLSPLTKGNHAQHQLERIGGKPMEFKFASRNRFNSLSALVSDSKSISITDQFSSDFSSVNTMKPLRWPSVCLCSSSRLTASEVASARVGFAASLT